MIYYAILVILIDLYSQKYINIYLFELFFTCIEKNIYVPGF